MVSTQLDLTLPVSALPMVGPSYVEKLAKLGIHTLEDLLHYYPFRYVDLSATTTVASLQGGEVITLAGTIVGIQNTYTRFGKTLQKAIFSDGTGTLAVTWFNQPYLVQTFQKNPQVSLSGTVKIFNRKPSLSSPQYELIRNNTLATTPVHTGRLVPIYPETAGVSSKWLRSRINTLLKIVAPETDWLPDEVVKKNHFIGYDQALREIHFPSSSDLAYKARERLSFDELLVWQLVAQMRKRLRSNKENHFIVKNPDLKPFLDKLPFTLTTAQQVALHEVLNDFSKTSAMNRLLQGDVGSGKTMVAAAAMYVLANQGFRSVLMAPTEILAIQHAKTLESVLTPLGIRVKTATHSQKEDLSDATVVVGTHAILFRDLPSGIGLVVIDEQHRFGVNQRSKLLQSDHPPHLLSMTATPIPRTVALTLYAELDVSIIDELPKGRIPIKTWVVGEHKRKGAYEWIEKQVQQGDQVFIVCPLIETSDHEAMSEVKAAEMEFERLKNDIFPNLNLGLVHGKLKSKDKDKVINDFASKKYQILVATPVIEVGIDIPNATVMIIEGAERFGLAQLHQLRGRVGRGNKPSYCLLFPTDDSKNPTRLKYMETTQSGFQLAELDLKLRGPGDVYGTKQSGFIDLKIATLEDEHLIRTSHQYAASVLDTDPDLSLHPTVKNRLERLVARLSEPN